jgi:CubicO group peptidase (beta-lactamase class C family)
MELSRRDQLRWLLALPFASIAGRSLASGADTLLGTWSGMVEDDAGRVYRFRLVITHDGVNLYAIDVGLVDARASKVELNSPAIYLELASLGVTVRGALVGRDRIDAVVISEGQTQKAIILRGDLYPVVLTKLPAGPMTRDRLRSLLMLSQAPAIGVGWSFERGTRTVLVDGVRSVGMSTAVNETDAWHIGSDTKSMTATLVGRLVEAGYLRWNMTINELLSPKLSNIRSEYRQATLIDLSHHAGLPRDARKDSTTFAVGLKDARAERLTYARLVLTQPPVAAPRTTTNYSNAGYVIVGAMIEQVMGASWETLIVEHLFAPLRMRSAGFGPPATPGKVDAPVGHARGHDNKLHPSTTPAIADLPSVMGPAGLVHVSLNDLLTYLEAHRDRPERLLTRATWDKLQTPPYGDGYALGWGVDGKGRLSHEGSNGMWLVNVLVDRPSGMAFAGALNATTPQSISAIQQASEAALLSGGSSANHTIVS